MGLFVKFEFLKLAHILKSDLYKYCKFIINILKSINASKQLTRIVLYDLCIDYCSSYCFV